MYGVLWTVTDQNQMPAVAGIQTAHQFCSLPNGVLRIEPGLSVILDDQGEEKEKGYRLNQTESERPAAPLPFG